MKRILQIAPEVRHVDLAHCAHEIETEHTYTGVAVLHNHVPVVQFTMAQFEDVDFDAWGPISKAIRDAHGVTPDIPTVAVETLQAIMDRCAPDPALGDIYALARRALSQITHLKEIAREPLGDPVPLDPTQPKDIPTIHGVFGVDPAFDRPTRQRDPVAYPIPYAESEELPFRRDPHE